MEISWKLVIGIYLCNFVYLCLMFLGQCLDKRIPPRGSIIPGTNQKIMHMQDWYTLTWGDIVAVPLILSGFAHVAINKNIHPAEWAILIIASNVIGVYFLGAICLSDTHRPDAGTYDIGKQSLHGYIHVPYFGICVAIAAAAIYHRLITGELNGPALYLGLLGGAIYIASFLADLFSGHFAPLKLEENLLP